MGLACSAMKRSWGGRLAKTRPLIDLLGDCGCRALTRWGQVPAVHILRRERWILLAPVDFEHCSLPQITTHHPIMRFDLLSAAALLAAMVSAIRINEPSNTTVWAPSSGGTIQWDVSHFQSASRRVAYPASPSAPTSRLSS